MGAHVIVLAVMVGLMAAGLAVGILAVVRAGRTDRPQHVVPAGRRADTRTG